MKNTNKFDRKNIYNICKKTGKHIVKFSKGNSKLQKTALAVGTKKSTVYTFSLPAGWSCPMADVCKSKVVMDSDTGKRSRQDFGKFVCYATKAELIYKNTYNLRHGNFNALREAKTVDAMYELLQNALPGNAKIVRYHDSGDFFNQNYFGRMDQVSKK